MSISTDLVERLSSYPKIDEGVYDLGGCIVALTPRHVYIGSDLYYEHKKVGQRILHLVGEPRYKKKAMGAFECDPLPEESADVIIFRGRHYHRFLDEWRKVPHRKFLEELTQSLRT